MSRKKFLTSTSLKYGGYIYSWSLLKNSKVIGTITLFIWRSSYVGEKSDETMEN